MEVAGVCPLQGAKSIQARSPTALRALVAREGRRARSACLEIPAMLSSSRDVVMANLPRIRTLSPYAAYACRHRGVCCTSGWDIPVEAAVHGRLRDAMARGVLASKAQASFVILPPDSPAVAMVSPIDGTCPFYDAPDHRCSVHRALGETALPTSCRHFPRICRLDDEHVDVSFSHVCPTAGEALLDARTPFDAPAAALTSSRSQREPSG